MNTSIGWKLIFLGGFVGIIGSIANRNLGDTLSYTSQLGLVALLLGCVIMGFGAGIAWNLKRTSED